MGERLVLFVVTFVVAAALRILFWLATPDKTLPHSAAFRGDSTLWVEYAAALRAGLPFELGLPIHPPGTAWLVARLWDGSGAGIFDIRLAWALLGAAAVALFAVAAARAFGGAVGWAAGLFMAASTGLVLLSSSIGAEAPYLVLVAGSFLLWPIAGRSWLNVAAASVLHALACLVRVEHVVFYVALLLWANLGRGEHVRRLAVSLVVFAAALTPWHLQAWRAIERFNTEAPADGSARMADAVMRSLGPIAWDEDTAPEATKIPAFARPNATTFVAATVAHRGRRTVTAADFGILDQAFGTRPRPVGPRPFVTLYGPLNFALASDTRGTGGFNRAQLEDPPPLMLAKETYPAALVAGLPPADLTLAYPPHLALVNEGYAIGLRDIAARPMSYLRLLGRKLRGMARGASLGLTGYGFPAGLSGTIRPVDLATPDRSAARAIWMGLLGALAVAGVVVGRRNRELQPWLLFAATKIVVTLAFFGYARQGAQLIPVVALLVALSLHRAIPALFAGNRGRLCATLFAAACLSAETVRYLRPPQLSLDGKAVSSGYGAPGADHETHRFEAR